MLEKIKALWAEKKPLVITVIAIAVVVVVGVVVYVTKGKRGANVVQRR